jgi:homoserine O-acetyltransferase
MKVLKHNQKFTLESGVTLPSIEITYHTYGELNKKKSNVIWICHALTASSDAADWWSGLVGEGKVFDPKEYFIVCANILGSCYGSSGPLSINPETGRKYYSSFPQVTIRDMVNAHILLRKHLGIEKIAIGAGGSMGAYQLLEWAVMEPKLFSQQVLMNTGARESAWGISIHTAQRLAIEADPTWKNESENAGANGLKAARAIGMLTYRNYETFAEQQTDEDNSKLDDYKASSYIIYQGDKLVKRFNAYSYWLLTKSMDSHNLLRGRSQKSKVKRMEDSLRSIKTNILVIGMSSDFLCPNAEQKYLAKHLPNAKLKIVDSSYGHDGFLIEWEKLTKEIKKFIG